MCTCPWASPRVGLFTVTGVLEASARHSQELGRRRPPPSGGKAQGAVTCSRPQFTPGPSPEGARMPREAAVGGQRVTEPSAQAWTHPVAPRTSYDH